jgi:CRP-like cAMP-binding protein
MRRWLLMVHDRAKRDSFPITHEYIAKRLGTDRSEVTLAIGKLRDAGLIKATRGQIVILDRQRLEESVCECYGIVRSELDAPC